MLKVFLVEDEVIVRNGIKKSIAWEKEGFYFAGEASDGELAYPLIKREKPDILITDIKMPFMDGLELSRLIKKEMPQIRIIILSGYDEFEFAKTAISIGVTDYLLKPFSSAKLLEAVKKVGSVIEKEREAERLELGQRLGIDISNIRSQKSEQELIEQFLKSGTTLEIEGFLEEYFLNAGEKNIRSLLFRQYTIMNLYFAATDFLSGLGISAEKLSEGSKDINLIVKNALSQQSTKECIAGLFREAIELRDNHSRKKYTELLSEAKRYIDRNYQREDMSLSSVAAWVNVSPSYFSAIFSAEMGQTFVEYLTHVRMEKAKELLMCSNFRTAEIGYEVGYKDSHYFSYIFKKIVGCSPKEYKNRGREQGTNG